MNDKIIEVKKMKNEYEKNLKYDLIRKYIFAQIYGDKKFIRKFEKKYKIKQMIRG